MKCSIIQSLCSWHVLQFYFRAFLKFDVTSYSFSIDVYVGCRTFFLNQTGDVNVIFWMEKYQHMRTSPFESSTFMKTGWKTTTPLRYFFFLVTTHRFYTVQLTNKIVWWEKLGKFLHFSIDSTYFVYSIANWTKHLIILSMFLIKTYRTISCLSD